MIDISVSDEEQEYNRELAGPARMTNQQLLAAIRMWPDGEGAHIGFKAARDVLQQRGLMGYSDTIGDAFCSCGWRNDEHTQTKAKSNIRIFSAGGSITTGSA